jgi:hypothetical protein
MLRQPVFDARRGAERVVLRHIVSNMGDAFERVVIAAAVLFAAVCGAVIWYCW